MIATLELQSPAELDIASAPLEAELGALRSQRYSYRKSLEDALAKGRQYDIVASQQYLDRWIAKNAPQMEALKAQLEPYEAEWKRRGGWSRYVHCVADGGHIHVASCFTLRPFKTLVSFQPQYSGLNEHELVERVKYTACTHCFPSAPLHPSWMVWERDAAAVKSGDKLAKWESGRARREKKLLNVRKRLVKAEARLALPDGYGNAANSERHEARYDIEWQSRDVKWAERELARWEAKAH